VRQHARTIGNAIGNAIGPSPETDRLPPGPAPREHGRGPAAGPDGFGPPIGKSFPADLASPRPLSLAHHSVGLLQNLISPPGYAAPPRAFMS
jgi:hypothetical protein